MAQKSKPAPQKSASDPTILALQEELKRQGYYLGNPDGIGGEATQRAVDARNVALAADREAKAQAEARDLKRMELEAQGTTAKAAAGDVTSKTRAREERQAQAASPAGVATQIGASTVAPIVGIGAGRGIGLGVNRLMDASQASKNAALAGVAADRTAGLTTREGAMTAAARSGALPAENALLRNGGRMLPHLALGGFMAGKGAVLLSQGDSESAFYPDMANKAAALAMLGAGTGIAERGITYGVSPGVAPDAQAMAVIGSNQLRRNNAGTAAPTAAAPRPALPGSKADLMAQAKRYNIAGRSTMGATELREAVGEAVKATTAPRGGAASKALKGLAGPAAAASLAYAMTPDQAQAADGRSPAVNSDALTNAGVAGGVAYGVQKGIDALPSAVGGAVRAAGAGVAPANIDAMTDYSPDELAQGRNMLARNLPSALRGGAVEDAYQIAQVPEPSPMRGQAQQDAGGGDEFETQLAALHDLLAQIGPDEPVANAVASQRANAMPPASEPMQQNRLLAGR